MLALTNDGFQIYNFGMATNQLAGHRTRSCLWRHGRRRSTNEQGPSTWPSVPVVLAPAGLGGIRKSSDTRMKGSLLAVVVLSTTYSRPAS